MLIMIIHLLFFVRMILISGHKSTSFTLRLATQTHIHKHVSTDSSLTFFSLSPSSLNKVSEWFEVWLSLRGKGFGLPMVSLTSPTAPAGLL